MFLTERAGAIPVPATLNDFVVYQDKSGHGYMKKKNKIGDLVYDGEKEFGLVTDVLESGWYKVEWASGEVFPNYREYDINELKYRLEKLIVNLKNKY